MFVALENTNFKMKNCILVQSIPHPICTSKCWYPFNWFENRFGISWNFLTKKSSEKQWKFIASRIVQARITDFRLYQAHNGVKLFLNNNSFLIKTFFIQYISPIFTIVFIYWYLICHEHYGGMIKILIGNKISFINNITPLCHSKVKIELAKSRRTNFRNSFQLVIRTEI